MYIIIEIIVINFDKNNYHIDHLREQGNYNCK